MDTKYLGNIRYRIAREDILVWKVFLLCPFHNEYEGPFTHTSLSTVVKMNSKRIGLFAFLNRDLARVFSKDLILKNRVRRYQRIVAIKLIIPKGTKYRIGYLPKGCTPPGLECVAANKLIHTKDIGESNFETMP